MGRDAWRHSGRQATDLDSDSTTVFEGSAGAVSGAVSDGGARPAGAQGGRLPGLAGPTAPGSTDRAPDYRIAVVGSGPRGMSVLERLASRLLASPVDRGVHLYLIDGVEVGCGRVWRTDQPQWFLMNTVCREVTMFSGPPDEGPPRPGAGPSLAQWWRDNAEDYVGPDGYAPRRLHARYLRFVLDTVERALPGNVVTHRVPAMVEDIEPTTDGYRLDLSGGNALLVDRVVLTTGHSQLEQTGRHRVYERFAATRPNLRYFPGESPADLPLDTVPAGSAVGVMGLGLTFYDLMLAFTLGRGGRFREDGDGHLVYLPSGREPRLYGGSRSGMPLPARGRNQKSSELAFTPTVFTTANVTRGHDFGTLDFTRHMLPWIIAEIELVYYQTALREQGDAEAAAFLTAAAGRIAATAVPPVSELARPLLREPMPPLDFERLCRPFVGATFDHPDEFDRALTEYLRRDLERAERGNYADPIKAALDVLRDTRWVVREIVDFGGLTPDSHRDGFLSWFAPRSALLAAGPPRSRLRQAQALRDAGLLRVVGPDLQVGTDEWRGCFTLSSPAVADSIVAVETLIDARTPTTDINRDRSILTRNLVRRGVWTEFTNGAGPDAFRTGGVAVTQSPYHPIDRRGRPDRGLYVLGIPAEHTRWFTLVGSGRPGSWNEFTRDADAIARDALAGMTVQAPTQRRSARDVPAVALR
ncbi:FAD/NAD(P)-binding protein [Frankia sp. CcI49]|uniref:FAD/NAD(P)-binding protein n=1 Tax=Frankia sp. CcI49 TaxID=1745382 RepID=UPI0009FDCE9D|nr:FAD/NAD(P)-binding protein [Frankia sp. CcI49]